MSNETLYVLPYQWEVKEEKHEMLIRMWAKDRDSNTVNVRFHGFPAFCQLQLPKYIGIDGTKKKYDWNDLNRQRLYNSLCSYLKYKGKAQPYHFECQKLKELYYYTPVNDKVDGRSWFMTVYFNTMKEMYDCERLLRWPFRYYYRKGKFVEVFVKVHETKIPIVRKLLTYRNSTFSGWLKCEGYKPKKRPDMYDSSDEGTSDSDDDILEKDVFGNVIRKDGQDTYFYSATLDYKGLEYIGDYETISVVPAEMCLDWSAHPRLLGFDIEAYSDKHRCFPQKDNIKHVTFMISCVCQLEAHPETRLRYCVVLGRCNEIPEEKLDNSIIVEVKSEVELIYEFAKIVIKEDPDILLGYNIFDFDYPYLDQKLELRMKEWPNMGRIVGEGTEMDSKDWNSGGYGFNSINDLIMAGRISIDMYPVVKRDDKLLKYNLDFVSKHFLGREKHDVTPIEMFLTYERQRQTERRYEKRLSKLILNDQEDKELFYRMVKDRLNTAERSLQLTTDSLISKEFTLRGKYLPDESANKALEFNDPAKGEIYNRHGKLNWCSNKLWELLSEIAADAVESCGPLPGEWRRMSPRILGGLQAGTYIMTRVAYYCLIDSDLCIDLFDVKNTWINLVGMSAVAGVPIKEIFTRGQQVRSMSLIYDYAAKNGIVITKRDAPEIDFVGGFVFDCNRGVWDGVAVADFNSLYPSIIMAYNLCYTTLIRPSEFYNYSKDEMTVITVPRPDDEDETLDVENDKAFENGEVGGMSRKQIIRAVNEAQKGVVSDEKNLYHGYIKPPVCPTCSKCEECCRLKVVIKKHLICDGCTECKDKCQFPEKTCDGCSVCQRENKKRCHLHQDNCCAKVVLDKKGYKGLLPRIMEDLLGARKIAKKQMAKYEKHTIQYKNEDSRQLALKVTANALYGFTGAGKRGVLPCLEISTSVTSKGRDLIQFCSDLSEQKLGMKTVYGDTDSVMVKLPDGTPKNMYVKMGWALAKEISTHFIDPLNLDLEKVMKAIFIKKKMYVGYMYKSDGTFLIDKTTGKPEMLIRGIPLARRDNAAILREIYETLIRMILEDHSFLEVLNYVVLRMKEILDGEIHFEEFITVRSIGAHYKNQNYFMKLFKDSLIEKGKPANPGERLGYLVTRAKNEDQEKYLGKRMILPEEYVECLGTTNQYDVDYHYYIGNIFMGPLDTLIDAGFHKVFDKYSGIKFRRSKRCKFITLDTPIKMLIEMAKNGFDIGKIIESVKAVDENDPRGPVLSPEYEANGFEYPKKKDKSKVSKLKNGGVKIRINKTRPKNIRRRIILDSD